MARYREEILSIPTLVDALQARTVDQLKPLAGLLSDKKPTRKADLVKLIHEHLQGDKLRATWNQLDSLQQAAVAEAVHGPETVFRADRFVAKYGQQPNWGERDRWGYSYRKPSLLAAFFYNNILPEDLCRELRQLVPAPKEETLNSVAELPQQHQERRKSYNYQAKKNEIYTWEAAIERRETEISARHDLAAVLALIDAGKVAVSEKTRLPGAAAIKAVSAVLWGGDFYNDEAVAAQSDRRYYQNIGPIRAFAWPMLLQAGGLAQLSGKRLGLSKAGQRALHAAPEKTINTLWRRWLKTTLLDELRRIDDIKGQTGKGKRGLTAVAGRRAAIDAALETCPPGRWVEVSELFRYMRSSGGEFDFEVSRDPWALYIVDANYGSLGYQGYHDWPILQARYALCLLFEYAATLGLIDVAYIPPHAARPDYSDLWGTDDMAFFSRYDGLLYLRLTPLGAYCLGLSDSYTPAEPEQRAVLKILPNLEIVAITPPLSPADMLLLDTYSKRKSDAVWQLDQAKLLAAAETGKRIDELHKILAARSAEPLPETVERLLTDTEQRATMLQDKGPARLIECADAALATLIANDSRTRKLCQLAGDKCLVIPAEAETRFRSAVRKLGYSLPQ